MMPDALSVYVVVFSLAHEPTAQLTGSSEELARENAHAGMSLLQNLHFWLSEVRPAAVLQLQPGAGRLRA